MPQQNRPSDDSPRTTRGTARRSNGSGGSSGDGLSGREGARLACAAGAVGGALQHRHQAAPSHRQRRQRTEEEAQAEEEEEDDIFAEPTPAQSVIEEEEEEEEDDIFALGSVEQAEPLVLGSVVLGSIERAQTRAGCGFCWLDLGWILLAGFGLDSAANIATANEVSGQRR
eukprot:SAG31_NODE_7013_length_1817_cov_3.576834_1_plen_171_part_00